MSDATPPPDSAGAPDSGSPDFETLYRDYGGRVLNLAFRMTGDGELSRDLTQEIFIKVYEHIDDFEGKSQVFTWIYRIATNHILNALKKNKRRRLMDFLDRPLGEVLTDKTVEADYWAAHSPATPDRVMEKREREQLVWRTIRSLPPKYRMPLVMFRYDELSYQEIAAATGLSLSAVETRIHRARKMLVERLTPLLEKM